ncbi:MAG: hypothetical protein Q4B54_08090 [Coriobacteriales bacterium]|nr:hypothetical protein [Coriobacteriales bacterium]
MRGVQTIRIRNKKVRYTFDLRRNITIVRGNSGTGKTTLYDMVASHTRLGADSGVQLNCTKQCVALVDLDWKNQLERTSDSIVFIDEGSKYVTSEEFARTILGSDNYYVIFSRQALYQLPYSIDEIYEIKTSGNINRLSPIHKKRQRHIYGAPNAKRDYDVLLTEDSKSGFEFYKVRFADSELVCESAGTNAGIFAWLNEHKDLRTFVIADGAAFGSQVDRVIKFQQEYPNMVTLCLPESFEWLLLSTGLVGDNSLANALAHTSDYVESAVYGSWEQYFSALLTRLSEGTPFAYSKHHLAPAWTLKPNADKVMLLIQNQNVR